jgi:hypothetical protein
MLNRVRDLLQNKANKPSRRARQPLNSEGNEGDFVISRLKDGLFVFFKVMGRWLKIFHSRTSLIPDQNKAFDIGSPTKRWKNLYLSNDAINIGDNRDTSGKITYDGTDLVFKNKAGTESKIVGKRQNSTGNNIDNEITLGDEASDSNVGAINIGAGSSFYGGIISGTANHTNQLESNYLGVRFLANSGGGTSVKGLSVVEPAGTSSKVYLATHNNGGGHIGIAEHATDPAAIDNYGLIYVDEDDHKLYYRHNELSGGTRIELGGGSGGIVTSGTVTPSATDITDKTPNKGDMYIQYTDTAGDNSVSVSGANAPIMYIRDSDTRIMKYYGVSGSSFARVAEFIDLGATPFLPRCTSIVLSNNSGTANSTKVLVKTSLNLYARCNYSTDVTSGGTQANTPIARFKRSDTSATEDNNLDTTYSSQAKRLTSNAYTRFVSLARDKYIEIDWVQNGFTVENSSGSAIAVVDGANSFGTYSHKVYARNYIYYGIVNGAANIEDSVDATNIKAHSTYLPSSSNYPSQFPDFGFTCSAGQVAFFAVPVGAGNITNITWTTPNGYNAENQLGDFETSGAVITVEDVQNTNNYEEDYKVWISPRLGAFTDAATSIWHVS